METGRWRTSFIGKVFSRRTIFSRLHFEKNHDLDNAIIVAGTGRSGTTWLARILNKYLHYRIIFEPFYPQKVGIFEQFKYKQYIPPNFQDEKYERVFEKILSGKIRNRWTDKANRYFRPGGRIIKTIRANFFLKYLRNNFPNIPIIFILRHPCAVVLSRERLGWEAMLDIVLNQELLIKDHLEPYMGIISKAETSIQRNTCLWCVETLVPLRTMTSEDWLITTYEYLCTNPENETRRILNYIGFDKEFKEYDIKGIIPMTVRKDSAILEGVNPLEAWRKNLSDNEINQILEIVEGFSLNSLYNEKLMPQITLQGTARAFESSTKPRL